MSSLRQHDLDWLRVLAFLLLIFFHSGMPFVTFGWHINNAETSENLSYLWRFLHNWRMPLLFMVSGAGIWYAIGNRSSGQFVKERCKRLLIPLVFGVLIIVPPQVYYERLAQGVHFDSYLSFYPHFFDGHIFAGGNFTPNHLWFIYTLFFCSILALPLFAYLKSNRGESFTDRVAILLSKPGGVYLLMFPIYLSLIFLKPYGREYIFEFNQLVLVICGFLIVSRESIMQAIQDQKQKSLMFAVYGVSLSIFVEYSSTSYPESIYYLANVFGYFSLLLAIFGYARAYLSFNNSFLKYTNKAVYPFYILHQTITVFLAYYIVPLEMNLWFKFLLTTFGTAIFTLALYHFLIRPFYLIHPLFGLKQKTKVVNKSLPLSSVDYN